MFERFTEGAREVMGLAQDEARALKHNYIGTEHLLLGLLRQESGIAANVLAELDVTLDAVRSQVERVVGRGEEAASGQVPFTRRAKRVLELALREALSLGQDFIGTEHLLIGLMREGQGVANRILANLDAGPDRVFDVLDRRFSRILSRDPAPRTIGRLVFELSLVTGSLLAAFWLGIGLLVGWAIWGH